MLKERIQNDMKVAMKAGEKSRLGTIRLMLAAIKQREVDERITLDDQQILAVFDKMIKQRRESLVQFRKGRREDLVATESNEIDVIQGYLPEALSAAAVEQLIDDAVQQTGASSMREMGAVMKILRPAVQGRVDMAAVSARVKARLAT